MKIFFMDTVFLTRTTVFNVNVESLNSSSYDQSYSKQKEFLNRIFVFTVSFELPFI